jgi:cytoskeletal protein CcmA (bactofilin family)
MGFNLKSREGGAGAAAGASGGVGMLTAFIDQGSEFSGKLSFKDTVRIDGTFEGEISSENTLIVGETGRIQANIQSETVIVSGEVRGDIHATRQLTVHKTARVYGNLRTASLVVEEGAFLSGNVKMGTDKSKKADAQDNKTSRIDEKTAKPGLVGVAPGASAPS